MMKPVSFRNLFDNNSFVRFVFREKRLTERKRGPKIYKLGNFVVYNANALQYEVM